MYSPHVQENADPVVEKQQSKVWGNASNANLSTHQCAFSEVEFNVTIPDTDFVSPSTFNEDHPEMPTPKEFVTRRRNSSVKLDDERDFLQNPMSHPAPLSAPSRSSHNRSVGYTMHLSDSNDPSLRKQDAANTVADFDKFLHQL